jgi:crotonobetainyl-CoA:carnitine CoA-transferase CaiB-like acyl-CoA transferase
MPVTFDPNVTGVKRRPAPHALLLGRLTLLVGLGETDGTSCGQLSAQRAWSRGKPKRMTSGPTEAAPPAGQGPLAGLLVADFSRILAGPYATMLMADLGAEVVKVEGPGGDDTRTWQPPARDGVATYYLGANRNKRSIALDLRDPGDVELARELARRADVFVENFKPGGLARFGLDYDSVAAGNGGVIYASISGFGSAPGGRSLPGYDLIVQAISGFMSLTGEPDGEPYRAGVALFDVMAGLHATIGVLAALNHRHATGCGQHIEVNLLSSALSGLVNQSSAFVAAGVVPFRMGNSHPSLYPYAPMMCADGELIVTAGNDAQFRKLCHVLGVPELAEDSRFARTEDRNLHRDELRPLLLERLRTRTKMEWFRDIIAAGVPCGPINTIDQGLAFADEVGLDPVVTVGEGAAAVPSIRNPISFSVTAPEYRLPPPTFDEHGQELRRWLAQPTAEEASA